MTYPWNELSEAEAEIVRAFSQVKAMSPESAAAVEDLPIADDAAFSSLLARGIARQSPSDPNKFYVPETEPSVLASRDQRRTVVAALRAVIAIAVGLFVWKMISLL